MAEPDTPSSPTLDSSDPRSNLYGVFTPRPDRRRTTIFVTSPGMMQRLADGATSASSGSSPVAPQRAGGSTAPARHIGSSTNSSIFPARTGIIVRSAPYKQTLRRAHNHPYEIAKQYRGQTAARQELEALTVMAAMAASANEGGSRKSSTSKTKSQRRGQDKEKKTKTTDAGPNKEKKTAEAGVNKEKKATDPGALKQPSSSSLSKPKPKRRGQDKKTTDEAFVAEYSSAKPMKNKGKRPEIFPRVAAPLVQPGSPGNIVASPPRSRKRSEH